MRAPGIGVERGTICLTRHYRYGYDSVMDIYSYVKTKGGAGTIGCPEIAALAMAADCSHRTLYMIAMGHKRSSGVLARRIADATGGMVTVHDLRPDIFGERPADQLKAA